MDEGPSTAVERVLAQRLASGEPKIRQRSLKLLQNYLQNESGSKDFGKQSFENLSKGLHYALWMQDKMLLQEELVDNICNLFSILGSDEKSIEFIISIFTTLSKEWTLIDRWRMDKFLMLLRRLFRCVLNHISSKGWDPSVVDKYIGMLQSTLVNDCPSFSESLKYHFASIYLDELYLAGCSDAKILDKFLQIYIFLLSKNISDSLFSTICSEIFGLICTDFSQRLREASDKGEHLEISMHFDYEKLSLMLFDIGKMGKLNSKRRKEIYGLFRRFEKAAKNIDPEHRPDDSEVRKLVERKKRKRIKV